MHKSYLFVFGVALLFLGVANWAMGSKKIAYYQRVMAAAAAASDVRSVSEREEILHPPDEERERYNIARAKVDLYHVVLSGGRFLVSLGAVMAVAGVIHRRIRTGKV